MSDSYWNGWLRNTSPYSKDLIWALNLGKQVLDKYKLKQMSKQKCVIFDIDDTLVFGDPEEVLGVKEMELGKIDGNDIFILPRNEPVVKLAEYAKEKGFTIIVITARPKTSRLASIENMKQLRIPYDALIMNDGDANPFFKVGVRRKIMAKYDICLTIGDQITDVICPGANTGFIKLPDPTLKSSYAYIPPNL
jgi:predicted secreted acid phosphatase